ncbi:type VI secretion system baseplate subunit TssK [Geoalkalibacter sp.]|uniref:type VI secretion system baseplate subunit TssK n=1 Tax=Geoalkalibacter sp. TaxID=3041440 RepID=UPI00272E2DB2|nr:type VI secretion system baseplate subunit TssK [Geoalkalibacter sp.]
MGGNALHKVVWAEGMFLGQQHFQHWDRYQEGVQALLARSLAPLGWGIVDLEIDPRPLESGRLRIERCRALFPDGRLVSYDAASDPPLMCALGGRGGETIEVSLGLPGNRQVEGISGYPGKQRLCAWHAEYSELADEFDPSRNREVLLARPNLSLLTAEMSRDAFCTLPLARVLNLGDGTYRLVPDYIPPVVCIGASAPLKNLLAGLVDLVGARLRSLHERRNAHGGGAAEFAQADPLHFQLFQVLAGVQPLLHHFLDHPQLHPELLYRALVPVVGTLQAFAAGVDEGDLPPYRQDLLGEVFPPLVARMERLLEIQVAQRNTALVLEREGECLWRIDGLTADLFEKAVFFLEVDHQDEDPNWINDFIRQVKVGPRSAIELMVATALSGVRLHHTQRPPGRMPLRSGCEYFRLEPRGDYWMKLVAEGSAAVFVPRQFAQTRLALMRVQE